MFISYNKLKQLNNCNTITATWYEKQSNDVCVKNTAIAEAVVCKSILMISNQNT